MRDATPEKPRTCVISSTSTASRATTTPYGHPAGDELLARLGGRLRGPWPRTARAYRLGGDEFCVAGALLAARPREPWSLPRAAP